MTKIKTIRSIIGIDRRAAVFYTVFDEKKYADSKHIREGPWSPSYDVFLLFH